MDFDEALNLPLMEYLDKYKFYDERYTNGTMIVPLFRVKNWVDYNCNTNNGD